MAHEDRPEAGALTRRLEESPYSFDFFHAVRRLECAFADRPRIGLSLHPKQDPVRFCQPASLSFAPSNISGYHGGDQQTPPRLYVNFLGLLGPSGPMPLHLTEYIRERQRHHHDHTLVRFLDVFNHRMISLFYRAWAVNQLTVSFDRKESDRFGVYLGSLFGMGMDSFRHRDAVDDIAKLYYCGHLTCPTKHAEGLAAILNDYFGFPVTIEQFVGQWIKLPPASYCRLGEAPQTGQLGRTVIVGSKVWECQQKYRIKFGPLCLKDFQRLLPGESSLPRLVGWVNNYAGQALVWDVQLILKAREVPQIELGRTGLLGWSTWLKSQPFRQDAEDVILRPSAA
ncbi:MAG: type VI secretion protein [Phycisphaerae bacterium SM23_30]|nr:MAG: type VI secretion protein [Phycisphaerae bacterium SM23_30]